MKFTGKKIATLTAAVILVVVAGWFSYRSTGVHDDADPAHVVTTAGPVDQGFVHPMYPFDIEAFASDVRHSEQEVAFSFTVPIKGGLIPHHTLPGALLSRFFRELSKQDPTTVIIIGPNHPDAGSFRVLTSGAPWETPFGRIESDEAKVAMILDLPIAGTDEEILSMEHSIAGVLPFVKYFLPDTKVVPIAVDSRLTRTDIRLLSEAIARMSDGRTVVLAAVDFSHYLPARVAEEKDRETGPLLRGFRTEEILRLGNDHVDSPTSVVVFLETMRKLGAMDMDLLANTNSGRLLSNDRAPSTSYFFAGFSGGTE